MPFIKGRFAEQKYLLSINTTLKILSKFNMYTDPSITIHHTFMSSYAFYHEKCTPGIVNVKIILNSFKMISQTSHCGLLLAITSGNHHTVVQ